MGNKIRGHIYPKFLIKNFCDEEKKGNLVWAYNKKKDNCIYPVSYKNALTKSNVYIADPDRILTFPYRVYPGFLPPLQEGYASGFPIEFSKYNYESELARLEGKAKEILEQLVDLAHNSIPDFNTGKHYKAVEINRLKGKYRGRFFLTVQNRISLIWFLTSLICRTKVDYEKIVSETSTEIFGDWILQFPCLLKDWVAFQEASNPVEILVRGRVPELFSTKGIAVLVIKNSQKSFVIGDRPFVEFNGYDNLLEAKAELYVAVSPRVAIGFLGNDGMGSEIRVFCINHNSLGDKFIRSFNEQVFRNSNTVVARSKGLLESLAVQK